jgi:oligoribonuclease NrnB/cAMP/cGMP phosphodiesterase (DHH superfamily)
MDQQISSASITRTVPDGFASAWVLNRWNQGLTKPNTIEFHGMKYGDDIPPINNRHLIFIDFSLKRDEMIETSKFASSITVLDHHKTAEENLKDIEPEMQCDTKIVFDMNRSGCEIAWDYFFENEEGPKVLANIADRDLWQFKLPNTKAISSAVFSYEYTFENWDNLMNPDNYNQLVSDGKAIERKHMKDVVELFNNSMVPRNIEVDGKLFRVPTFNVPYFHSSELGHYAMEKMDIPFALCWQVNDTGLYKYSLRSIDEKEDVSVIAKHFGGGGHRNAAGFESEEPIWL